MNKEIFKSYDIRGVYPGDIDAEAVYKIARATVVYTGASSVVVGRDMRASSPELTEAVIRGVTDQGADVIDVGLVSTPLFYFSVADYDVHDAGIMVTASHNPKEYNGMKIIRGDAQAIGLESGLAEIRDLATAGDFPDVPRGTVIETSTREQYLEKLFEFVPPASCGALKVVADCGNGMGGLLLADIFSAIGGSASGGKRPPCELTPMYAELDGNFPNHEANPIKEENLADLKKKVLEVGADLGVAYDGDADRVGFVDGRGKMIRGDIVAILLAKEILRVSQGALILGDVRATKAMEEEVREAGGTFHFSRVGHAHIKRQMKEEGAKFAGELSAHYYFADFPGYETGDLVMLYVLAAISSSGKSLAELVAAYGRYFHSGEINFTVADKEKIIAAAKEKYAASAESVLEIDGLRVDFPEWWFSLRASNTEPLLRLNLEATTKELMEEKKEELEKLINDN